MAGYLYLYGGSSIALTAATDGAEEPSGLRAFLAERLRADDECAEAGTAIATGDEAPSEAAVTWTDTTGNEHQPWLLLGTIDGEARAIGIVSFVLPEQAAVARSMPSSTSRSLRT